MKNNTLKFAALVAALALVASGAFAQTPVPQPTQQVPGITTHDPILYQVADTSFKAPTDWYHGETKLVYGEIKSLYAVTDNSNTFIRTEFKPGTDPQRAGIRLYIDSDGNARTGSGIGYYPGQTPINDFGFDYEVFGGQYGVNVKMPGYDCCLGGYAVVSDSSANSVTFKISNRLFGGEGVVRSMRFQVTLFDAYTGVNLSVSPANGVASIQSTTLLKLSPSTGTRLYKIRGEESSFNLVADISTLVPDTLVTLFVQINDQNFSESFRVNSATGTKTINQARIGGPNYWTFTKRFVYPIGSMIEGGGRAKIVYTILTSEGLATDTVEYTAEEIVEAVQTVPVPHQ